MTNSLKDRLSDDFEKAKANGKPRISRIREIFQEAASQVMVEVKAGSSEVQEIAKGTFSAVSEDFKSTDKVTSETSDGGFSMRLKGLLVGVVQVVKQGLDKAVAWYNTTKVQAEASDSIVPQAWEQKQAEVENQVGKAGTFFAQKEQQVRQQLKDFLQTGAAKL